MPGISTMIGIGVNRHRSSQYWTPLNFTVVNITGGVRLSWAALAGASSYEIWYSVDGGAYSLLTGTNSTSYDDMTERAGATVLYKIRGEKDGTYSAFTSDSSITIPSTILSLAATWVDDFARITLSGATGWQTELYESKDGGSTYTLVTTLADGVEIYDNYTWQGTTMYFKARAKKGSSYGDYCDAITLATPLVLKAVIDAPMYYGPVTYFDLVAGKTVHADWGNGTSADFTTNNYYAGAYIAAGTYYQKLSGDLSSIKLFDLSRLTKYQNDISKWMVENLTALIDIRLYDSGFTGDLSLWNLPATCTKVYLSETVNMGFTGIPRGHLEQIEASVCGIYMLNASLNTAALDSWLSYANTYFANTPPIRNGFYQFQGAGNGVPTGGNSNTNRLGIMAKYTAAGFTGTINVKNS